MANGDNPHDNSSGTAANFEQTSLQSDHAGPPSERDIAEKHNKQVEENIKRFKAVCLSTVEWIDRHNGVFLAAATIAIAVLTWSLASDSGGQLSAIRGQLTEMQLNGTRADKLIQSNTDLAAAAKTQAKAAELAASVALAAQLPQITVQHLNVKARFKDLNDHESPPAIFEFITDVGNIGPRDAVNVIVSMGVEVFAADTEIIFDKSKFDVTKGGTVGPGVLFNGMQSAEFDVVKNCFDTKKKLAVAFVYEYDDNIGTGVHHREPAAFQIGYSVDPARLRPIYGSENPFIPETIIYREK